MTRLRKADAEALLAALESATSGPLEEITVVREALTVTLRLVLDRPDDGWPELIDAAAARASWSATRQTRLRAAAAPQADADPDDVLWALWDLVTELNETRDLA